MKHFALAMLGIAVSFSLSASAGLAEDSGNGAKGDQCRVIIDRSQAAGVFDVTRQSDDDGNCICYAYTGPETQDNATEAKVTDLNVRKRCPDARLMAVAGPAAGAATGGSGFLAGPLAPLLAIGALGGGAAAASGSGSSGPGTPVSP